MALNHPSAAKRATVALLCVVACFLATTTPQLSRPHRRLHAKNRAYWAWRSRRKRGGLAALADPKTLAPRAASLDEGARDPVPPGEGALVAVPPAATALAHDGQHFCVASANDGRITAAAVLDERDQYVNLALPLGYAAPLALRCTDTSETTGKVREVPATHEAPPLIPGGSCDPRSFQPGFYDRETATWHDGCTGRQTLLAARAEEGANDSALLAAERCPLVATRKVVWVSFVGDSVTMQIFRSGMREAGVDLNGRDSRIWRTGRNFKGDHQLLMKGDAKHQIWFTYQFNFISKQTFEPEKKHYSHSPNAWAMPLSWGDFVRQRGEEPRMDDPDFATDRTPDVVFYSPGYHATPLPASQYGEALAGVLRTWREDKGARVGAGVSSMPPVHLLLNMMPAPWLIPRKYKADRPRRTELNEYRRNLAIIAAAREFDFVRSVVDTFSVELPFNGHRGKYGNMGNSTAHKDAVHIGDWRILRVIGDLILDRLCNSG